MTGAWGEFAILAAQILRHRNTFLVAPNLYIPDLPLTAEQERFSDYWLSK
jgi:hypothetical protein